MLMIMQPEEQTPDYNFIMNPGPKPKKSLLGGGGKTQRVLVAVIGGVILLMAIIFILMLAFGGSDGQVERLVSISQDQTEIVRVAALGEKDATEATTKNFATTVRSSTSSANTELNALINKQGRKFKKNELNAAKDDSVDKLLITAKQNNTFDETFNALLQKKLVTYQQKLKTALANASSKTEKALLQKLQTQASVLATTSR